MKRHFKNVKTQIEKIVRHLAHLRSEHKGHTGSRQCCCRGVTQRSVVSVRPLAHLTSPHSFLSDSFLSSVAALRVDLRRGHRLSGALLD